MITFNGLGLFGSGPSSIEPGPYESRDAVMEAPGTIGASAITQGTRPRTLRQHGTLIADDEAALQALIDTIQAQVGSGAAALIDQHGKAWPNCLMQRFETQAFRRLGPRTTTRYGITYLQTQP
ncbi:MAG: hypothetical protein AAGC44_05695 [Planctomycetota bacterium]